METSWKIYKRTKDAWDAMLLDMKGSENNILLLQYLLADFEEVGDVGKEIIDAVSAKAEQDIEVVLGIDPVGSIDFYTSKYPGELKDKGVKVLFNNFHSSFFTSRFPHIHIDHRKLLILDEKKAYVGGVVFTEDFRDWSDVMVSLEGPIVSKLLDVFRNVEDCMENGAELCPVEHDGSSDFNIELQRPGLKNRDIYESILSAINRAQDEVHIVTPYFSPGPRFIRTLKRASKRGVKVSVLFPDKTDHGYVTEVNKSFISTLLKHGVSIYLFKPYSLHAKFVTVDKKWVTVGSCNMDILSFWFNYELNLSSDNKDFVRDMNEVFLSYADDSKVVTKEMWQARSLKEQLLHKAAKLLRPFA